MSTEEPLSDDEIARLQDHTLIMGVMGVGTFVLGFFFLVVAIIWFLSYSCAPVIKSVWRGVSTALFFIAALIMVYAPRTNQYEDTSFEPDVRNICFIFLGLLFQLNLFVFIPYHRYMTIRLFLG